MKYVECPECNGRQWNWSDHSPNAFREKCDTCNGWGEVLITKYLLFKGWRQGSNGWVEYDVESGELYVNEDGKVELLDHESTTIELLREAGIKKIETLLKNEL